MSLALLLLLTACRTEPPQPVPPRITQLPKRNPITPSTAEPGAPEPSAPSVPSVPADAGGTANVRQMMTPADESSVVAPPADAGGDAIVQLPPVPDAQIPLDGHVQPAPPPPATP